MLKANKTITLMALISLAVLLISSIPETPNILLTLFGALFIVPLYVKFLAKNQSQANIQIVYAFSTAIEYKDEYTRGHSLRVASYARETAKHMGYSPHFVERVYIAGLLHDVGKIVVPESILQKPGKLTEWELIQMKRHVEFGVNILQKIEDFEEIVAIIGDHHESWNGSGYPVGKKGMEICLGGRILAVADAYDAMTSKRVYRSSISRAEACQELKRCCGSQFDPETVEVFSKWHCS